MVNHYDALIRREAAAQGVDADLVKAIMYMEISHGGSYGYLSELLGFCECRRGIVVVDLNNDGRINSSKEMLSEYYNGVQGTGGSAGSTPYANGFEALASLDSNNDKLFDHQDAAWGTVKVWVDGNSNGETDAGELHTLASLGVVSINLDAEAQSGAILDGNEVLASSTFTINPGSGNEEREAIAANFIANPDGHTVTEITGGTQVISPCYLKLPVHRIHNNGMAFFIQSGVAPLCRKRRSASSRLALNKNERTLKYAPQVARVHPRAT